MTKLKILYEIFKLSYVYALFEKYNYTVSLCTGKIEKTDWNVKEIEKKIEENKMGRSVRHDKVERVPKWSREQVGIRMNEQYSKIKIFQMCICFIQFLARQIKMEKKGRDQKETDSKYADIDNTLKNIDRKIKEGNVLGYNKVSAMAEQFSNKSQDAEPKVQKSVNTIFQNFSTGGYSQQDIRNRCHDYSTLYFLYNFFQGNQIILCIRVLINCICGFLQDIKRVICVIRNIKSYFYICNFPY